MIDMAARMRYVYIRTYAGQRPPDEFIARADTIRGRLIFLCASAIYVAWNQALPLSRNNNAVKNGGGGEPGIS